MRTRRAPLLAAAFLAALASSGAVPAAAHVPAAPPAAVRPPTCATGEGRTPEPAESVPFPVRARILDGPDRYRPGDAPAKWRIELANTTDRPCARIHPVVVLVDRARTLTADDVRLEFRDPEGKWLPVQIEHTDRDENVGVLEDGSAPGEGFPGFVVAPRDTLPVELRLSFAAGARPDPRADAVAAKVALVQRRDDDGDWVGESGAYTFALDRPARGQASPPGRDPQASPRETANPDASGRRPGTDPEPDTETSPGSGRAPGTGDAPTTGEAPTTDDPGHPDAPRGGPARLAETGEAGAAGERDALARLAAIERKKEAEAKRKAEELARKQAA
ncbi:hypothetical protein DY218_21635, partial [Streptomyces triticagri]